VVHSLARQVIPPIVHALRRHYPEIQLRLTSSWSGALRREVEDGLLDAAIVLTLPRPHVPSGLEGIQLAPEPVRLIASTQTTLKGTVAPEDLRGSEWVLSREGCGYRALLKRTLEEAGIPLSVVVEVLDIDLQLQLIAEGVGLGIIAARALPPRLEAAGLQTFSLSDISFALEAWLFHRRHGPLIPVAMPFSRTRWRLSSEAQRRRDNAIEPHVLLNQPVPRLFGVTFVARVGMYRTRLWPLGNGALVDQARVGRCWAEIWCSLVERRTARNSRASDAPSIKPAFAALFPDISFREE
jgi:hypothetical protein